MNYKLQKQYRYPEYNYGMDGFYFITICTHNRECFFGKVQNGIMCLNAIGSIAYRFFEEIPQHYSYAIPDTFVIMPDHMHGIIEIRNNGICRTVDPPFLRYYDRNHDRYQWQFEVINPPLPNGAAKMDIYIFNGNQDFMIILFGMNRN